MSQISLKYTRNEHDLTVTIERVVTEMDNKAIFADAPAALAELKNLLPVLHTARANALSRDKKAVSLKNDTKAIALNLIQQLQEYVMLKSKGDRTMILESGFDVTAETRKNNLPPSIERLDVFLGITGEITTRTRGVAGVKAYIHQYATEAPAANTVWIGEGSSDGSYTFQGLTSGKQYWFRVVVIGYNKQRAYSQVVSRFIQ